MKPDQSMGLVIAGGLHRLFLSRMPALLGRLGPVKGASFQVARRESNSLRAGYAVEPYSALEMCDLIWIAVSEDALDRVVSEMAAQIPMHKTMIVLCDSVRASTWAQPLIRAGAKMASVNAIDEAREGMLIMEGEPDVLRCLRKLFARERHKVLEIEPMGKATYFAGIDFGTRMLMPWIDASTACFRAAGLTRSQATDLVQDLCARAVRAYVTGGVKTSHAAAPNPALADRHLAELYAEGIRLSPGHFPRRKSAKA